MNPPPAAFKAKLAVPENEALVDDEAYEADVATDEYDALFAVVEYDALVDDEAYDALRTVIEDVCEFNTKLAVLGVNPEVPEEPAAPVPPLPP